MPETQVEESIIGKLTIASLGCNPSAVKTLPDAELHNGELPLARLYGKLNDVRYQTDVAKGTTYVYFVGTFEGINMQTGEVMRSGKLFLPKGVSELVEDATKKAHEKDDKASIAFAFEVRSIKASNPAGYTYKVLALKNPEAEDELKQIRDIVHKAGTIEVKRLTGSQAGKATTINAPVAAAGARKSA